MEEVESSVLVVEDNPINRKLLVKGLSDKKFKVDDVASTTRALKLAKQNSYDMFLLDIHMPIMNGLEFAKIIKDTKRYVSVPIIFITGSRDKDEMRQGYEVGGVDFILKPYNMLEVVSKVQVHLELARKNEQLIKYANEMEALAQLRAKQLMQADRLATLGALSASIAHEINNPLAFISSNIQILEKYWAYINKLTLMLSAKEQENHQLVFIREEMPKAFYDMKEGIKRVSNIAHKLKSFVHKPQKSSLGIISIKDFIEEAIAMAMPSVKNKVSIDLDQSHLDGKIFGNKEEIIQVLLNLLINGAQALEKTKDAKIKVWVEPEGEQAVIHVCDNGPGIPVELIDQIFDPFFTTKEKGKGTGLGLSISRDIMNAQGGKITVTNESTGGAHFVLLFKNKEGS